MDTQEYRSKASHRLLKKKGGDGIIDIIESFSLLTRLRYHHNLIINKEREECISVIEELIRACTDSTIEYYLLTLW